jgi:hypothetical protein
MFDEQCDKPGPVKRVEIGELRLIPGVWGWQAGLKPGDCCSSGRDRQ